MIDDLY
jgi:hypothetical protein